MHQVRCRLAGGRTACMEARAFIASECAGCSTETLQIVRLLTSELVGNAMWHGPPGAFWVDVQIEPGHVRVGVTDGGSGAVRFAPAYRWPESGHGLRLVDALADRWGVEPLTEQPGKRVWFEMTM